MYQALYRKWRPQTFADVVGQSAVTDTLAKQIETNHTSHAYLFSGSRGTGKTTCAKILSKAINCENPFHGNPCNKCPTCMGISGGEILDVVEIDAASNNGVDYVRDLREEAIYSPANAKKRVYIIDEVHMFSTAAFNALLKIMEEPPEHVVFILATTELHKVPATISSRCQRFVFKRIPLGVIAERLLFIAKNEGAALAQDAANYIASLSDGAMRDALSLLDQCISVGNGTVDEQAVENVVGLAGRRQTFEMASAIARQDVGSTLTFLNEIYTSGKNLTSVLNELAEIFRDVLVLKTTQGEELPRLSARYTDGELKTLSDAMDSVRLCFVIETLQNTTSAIAQSANKRIDAELCCVRLCEIVGGNDSEAILARLSALEGKLKGGVVVASQHSVETVKAPEEKAPKKKDALPKAPEEQKKEENKPPVQPPPAEERQEKATGDPREIWERVLNTARPKLSPGVAPLFAGVSATLKGNKLCITSTNAFVLQMLSRSENMEILRAAAQSSTPGIIITASKEQEEEKPETSGLDELLSGLEGLSGITIKTE